MRIYEYEENGGHVMRAILRALVYLALIAFCAGVYTYILVGFFS